jgi:catechol 2,3-dioxygenase-like lactoylglutathione lyase family enzyme
MSVSDLERSFNFYKDLLGMRPLMRHSKGAYFLAGDLWFCLDLDPSTRRGPLPEYTHVALSVDQREFTQFSEKLMQARVKIWKENVSEGDSLYFLDPDGHKLEIHVGDWKSRLESVKDNPWDESVVFFD